MDSFINDFLVEAKELLQVSTDGILYLEKNPDSIEDINKIFRAVHTMKSSSGLVGLDIFVGFLHAAEDALDDVRKGKLSFKRDLATMLLNMLDKLSEWISNIENNDDLPTDAAKIANNMALEFRNYKANAQREIPEAKPAQSIETIVPGKVYYEPQSESASSNKIDITTHDLVEMINKKRQKTAQSAKKSGIKTLVVEDDYITGQVMTEILSDFGECVLAENGLVAIEFFTRALRFNQHYDAIFLDIMMPEISGQEVLSLFRAIERGFSINGLDCAKVIMSTALGDFENVRKAFTHQCEGYIVKPVSKDKIVKSLQEINLV